MSGLTLTPFRERHAPPPRAAWKRWLRIAEPEKAAVMLESLFASTAPGVPTITHLSQVLADFGVKGAAARDLLIATFRRALLHAVADEKIDETEAAYLQRLRGSLGISDRELDALYQAIIEPMYEKAVARALVDRRLDPDEKARLERIVGGLRLSPNAAARVYAAAGQQVMSQTLKAVTGDQRLSPAEDAELQALVRVLGLPVETDADTSRAMDRMRLMWRIENGEIPTIQPPIVMQRGEVCHMAMPVDWYEPRTRSQTLGYHGVTTSIKILPGVRYRVGSISPIRIQVEEMVHADSGTLYLTNKRLIFDGQKKNTTMRLSSLLGFVPYTNGVSIEKSSGRPPTAQFTAGDAELFHLTLSAVLASQ